MKSTNLPFIPDLDYEYTIAGAYGLKTPILTDIQPLYHNNEQMFKALNKIYPGRFYNIDPLFKNITDIKKDPYGPDALHYGTSGSAVIGKRIFEKIDKRGVFSKKHYLSNRKIGSFVQIHG